MRISLVCILASMVCLQKSGVAAEASLETSVHAALPSGLPRPLLFADAAVLTGVVPEYTQAILDNLKQKNPIALLPHNRALNSLKTGRMDFSCYANRDWDENPDQLLWSEPLFIKREVIVGPTPLPKTLKELKGQTIGTMLGYKYPVLEPYFKSKELLREDGVTEESNFKKLQSNHIQYLVIDEIFLDYAKKTHPHLEKGKERLFVQEYPVSCAVSRTGHVTLADMNKAIAKLKSSGKLESIFKKYGLNLRPK